MQTIMLVDDDPTMLRLLQTLMEIEGFQAVAWSSGAGLIDEIKAVRPDAVLMDVNLRGFNGINMLTALRAEPGFAAVPIIMTSGMNYATECLNAGANAFLVKPYMPDQLFETLRAHLDREK